LPHFLYFIKN